MEQRNQQEREKFAAVGLPVQASDVPLRFSCPFCRMVLEVPREMVGVRGPCPGCRKEIEAPPPPDSAGPKPIEVKPRPHRPARDSEPAAPDQESAQPAIPAFGSPPPAAAPPEANPPVPRQPRIPDQRSKRASQQSDAEQWCPRQGGSESAAETPQFGKSEATPYEWIHAGAITNREEDRREIVDHRQDRGRRFFVTIANAAIVIAVMTKRIVLGPTEGRALRTYYEGMEKDPKFRPN